MDAEARRQWATRQHVIGQDHEDAAELISDFMAEPDHEAAAMVVAQWIRKIRVEGALWALSGNIEEVANGQGTQEPSEVTIRKDRDEWER